jgi:hypothetical protein
MLSAANRYPDTQNRLREFWKIMKGHSAYSAAGHAAIRDSFSDCDKAIELLLELYRKLAGNQW